jgi:selenocysteine lyase/cysteine desulfurase
MSDVFTPPEIDLRPDVAPAALQALAPGFDYFNVAGSGPTFPVAQRAADRFRTWLNSVGMFSHVGYDAYNASLERTREDLAAFVGDRDGASRVGLMQSATDGLNTLIAAAPDGAFVSTTEEHGSALLPLLRRERLGSKLTLLPYRDDESFLESVERGLARRPATLVLSLVSCRTGKVLPVAEAARLARAAGALSIVDAAQALGQIPVDVHALGADALVFLGHKWLHGPLATGAIWVADPARFDPPRLGWRSTLESPGDPKPDAFPRPLRTDATRFETGTVDAGAFVGLRQALAVHRVLGDTVATRLRALRTALLQRLAPLPLEPLSRPADPTGIVVVAPTGGDAAGIVARMWEQERIVVKHISDPGSPEAIRISFWALHDEAAFDRLATALARQLAVPA